MSRQKSRGNRNKKAPERREKPKRFVQRMKVRLLLLVLIIMGAMVWVGYTVYAINHNKGEKYKKNVLSQQRYDSLEIPYRRGDIIDRNGTYLATSRKVYNVVLEPKHICADEEAKETTVNALITYFKITKEEVDKALNDTNSLYKVILKKQPYEDVQAFQEYQNTQAGKKVRGVWFEEEYQRYYPLGNLACHVLGFTAAGNVGQGGVEGEYNSMLNGVNGRRYGYLNSDMSMETTTIEPINGNNIVTTIDSNIQNIIQNKINDFMTETGAKNVSVIAMKPANAEILALYNSNSYDPNKPYDLEALKYQFEGTDEERMAEIEAQDDDARLESLNKLWRNYVINDTFEPGSTFKTFTVAAALEENVLKGDETFLCDGGEQVANYYIHCHNHKGHGTVTIAGAMAKSCNDALMQIGKKLGRETFSQYQTVFGFGLKTNVDLPGEAYTKNLVYDSETLNEVELACCSFGQGLNVSMIQLATAFCSVVNGGNYYQPHVVKQIVDGNGSVVKNVDGVLLRKTISEATSEKLKDFLFDVVEIGTAATRGHIDGYRIGGKTGTAEKLPRGNGKYILSFICAVPIEAPELVLYVTVDEPNIEDPSHSGIATVLSKNILEELLPYMNIFQSNQGTVDAENAEEPEAVTPVFEGAAPEATGAGTDEGAQGAIGADNDTEEETTEETETETEEETEAETEEDNRGNDDTE
ncbi:MAG: penicillin-binding protein 2 [Lachnospiraceae bacterium]|nr:penicillin-binding protein 2 [Lachnospiraceae bacterium]